MLKLFGNYENIDKKNIRYNNIIIFVKKRGIEYKFIEQLRNVFCYVVCVSFKLFSYLYLFCEEIIIM